MGKKKAPSYATTTYDTGGLFGSSTASKTGTTYNPTSWISGTMNTVGNNWGNTLNNLLSGDFSNDANYQAYRNNLNRQMTQAYDTDVLSQLANRGLMRSSGLQSATNAFADTLANNEMNLYDNYYNRQVNNLANLMNTSNAIYSYITGLNNAALQNSNSVSGYNLNKYRAEQDALANQNAMFSSLANTIGNTAGSLYGVKK